MAGEEIREAVPGWCEIEGCNEKFMHFMIAGQFSPPGYDLVGRLCI